MEKITKKNFKLENNDTLELVLLDSTTDVSGLDLNNPSKIISLDYTTHKTLSEKKLSMKHLMILFLH